MTPAKKDDGDDGRPPERDPSSLAAFYRQKADECLRLAAEAARDPAARHEWITLANGWAQMAMHAKR